MKALGILGGTFDPIHLGHLAVAREAHRLLDLDVVLIVPNADPPHKGDTVTAAPHREAMVRLAIAGDPALVLSRIELERPGPSYAVDTVTALARQSRAQGRPEPWFILSADALRDLPSWREPGRILQHCRIAVAPRPGSVSSDRAWLEANLGAQAGRVMTLAGPFIDLASTDIRARVARGEDLSSLVPVAVAEYITTHGLYRDAGASHTTQLRRIERT